MTPCSSRKPLLSPSGQQRVEQVSGALALAAVAAVRRSQYDRPADGPISFTVVVPFGRDPAPAEQRGMTLSVQPDARSVAMRRPPGFDAPPQARDSDGALRDARTIAARVGERIDLE